MNVITYEIESEYDSNLSLRGQLYIRDGRIQVGSFCVRFRGKIDVTKTFSELEITEHIDELLKHYHREEQDRRGA